MLCPLGGAHNFIPVIRRAKGILDSSALTVGGNPRSDEAHHDSVRRRLLHINRFGFRVLATLWVY